MFLYTVYIYIYIYIYTYTHTYIYNVCVYVHTHTHTHTHTHIYICVYIHIYIVVWVYLSDFKCNFTVGKLSFPMESIPPFLQKTYVQHNCISYVLNVSLNTFIFLLTRKLLEAVKIMKRLIIKTNTCTMTHKKKLLLIKFKFVIFFNLSFLPSQCCPAFLVSAILEWAIFRSLS